MPIGKGGSEQSQSGSQSGQYTGNQSGLTYSGSNQSSTGSTSSTSSVNPNVPTQNQGYYNQAGANLSPNGLSATQQSALGGAPQPGMGTTAVQTSINDMNALKPGYTSLAGTNYTPYSASTAANPAVVNPQSGAAFMGQYQDPYQSQVVGTTLADFDRNTNNTLNQMRASRDAGSAFGDRSALADEQFLNDQSLKRAQTEGALQSAGFNTAAGYAQNDASRGLTAAQGNQNTAASLNMFNAGQGNQVAQNNANNAFTQQGLNLNALNSAGANANATSQLAQQGVRLNSDLANNLFNYGTTGQGQLINLFSAGNPLIGQTQSSSGNTSQNTTGENLGVTANQGGGNSQSTSQGSGSSKGGGGSFG